MRLRHLRRAVWLTMALLLVSFTTGVAGATEPVRILILPIVVHSAATDASHVSGGLSEMIAARLEQSGRALVERPEDEGLATTRFRDALREGQERGSDFVIYGAFTQFGDGASLDIQCIPAQVASEAEAAAARRIFIQSGAVGEIIPRLDDIAERLAAYVHAGRPAPIADDPSGAPVPAVALDDDALRSLRERLEALEEAVYGGGEPIAAEPIAAGPGADAPLEEDAGTPGS